MSVSIGFMGNDFSLIAADSLITNIRDGSQTGGKEKMFQTSFGFCAASGGVELSTTFFKEYLDTHIIRSKNDIYIGFLRAVKKTQDYAMKYYPDADKELSSSQYVYSSNYFKDGIPHMGINVLDFAYEQRRLNKQNTLIVNPPKPTVRIKRLMEEYSDIAKTVKDMHEAIYVVACFMDDLCKLSKWVDNNVCCGISLKISQEEILLRKITENAKVIKKLYEDKGDLSEIMMVRGSIGV